MLGWAAITQSTANCQLHCLECLHDKALCASHARYFASNYCRLTSSPPATKRTSWSNSSSTRQGTSREHQASPQCLEAALPLTPPPLTPRTARTMQNRTSPPVATCLLHLARQSPRSHPMDPAKHRIAALTAKQQASRHRTSCHHEALGDRDLNGQRSLIEPSAAPQRAQ